MVDNYGYSPWGKERNEKCGKKILKKEALILILVKKLQT